MKKILLITVLFLSIVSCTSVDKSYTSINFVFDSPLEGENYPAFLQDVLLPVNGEKCEKLVVFKPIGFVRLDIGNKVVKSKFWENIEARSEVDGMDEAAITEWVKSIFSGEATDYLKAKGKRIVGEVLEKKYIDKLKKNNKNLVLIYSESSMEESYNEIPIFTDINRLREKFKEISCDEAQKNIYIIVNPKFLLNDDGTDELEILLAEADDLFAQKKYQEALAKYKEVLQLDPSNATALQRIKEIENMPPPPPLSPCETKTISSAFELKNALVEVIDTKKSTEERIKLAEKVWNKYFDNDAYVAKYLHTNDRNSEVWDPGEAKAYFTDRLAILKSIYDVNIFRLEFTKDEPSKISGLHIVECHNASEAR